MQESWNQCLKMSDSKFLEAMTCLKDKLTEGSTKGFEKGAEEANKLLHAIGAQLKKCWTEEGAEFGGGEYFAECMGQMTFYAAASAVGGGMVKGGAELALKGGRMAQISGRALGLAGEWVVDPIGIATLGRSKLQKLDEVIKSSRNEAAHLIDQGAKLSREDSQQLNKYLNDYAKHVADAKKNPMPVLNESLHKKISDVDPQAVEKWQAKVADALETVSPKYDNTAKQILSSDEYREAQKAGVKMPTETEIVNYMKKIEKDPDIKDKDLALDVVRRINPSRLGHEFLQDSYIKTIKEMEAFHGHAGLAKLNPESLAATINDWPPQALEGLRATLEDANRLLRDQPTLSPARAVEDVMKKNGATREEILDIMPCAIGHGNLK